MCARQNALIINYHQQFLVWTFFVLLLVIGVLVRNPITAARQFGGFDSAQLFRWNECTGVFHLSRRIYLINWLDLIQSCVSVSSLSFLQWMVSPLRGARLSALSIRCRSHLWNDLGRPHGNWLRLYEYCTRPGWLLALLHPSNTADEFTKQELDHKKKLKESGKHFLIRRQLNAGKRKSTIKRKMIQYTRGSHHKNVHLYFDII